MEDSKKEVESGHVESNMDEETEGHKKGIRHRKKHIINKLRIQLEFYFSASNLSKDKFMIGLLQRSPYIDIDIFFKFNRIRALTDDINLLKRAIEKSKILEISKDGLQVKRIKPVQLKEEEASCTIYVESIPSHVDHEWVYEMFVKYGTIDYISFPRFKSTGRPKGFAFVEFATPEMANAALQSFGAIGCTIPDNLEPSRLQSICTHESEEIVRDQLLNSDDIECSDPSKKKDVSDENILQESTGKRKRHTESDAENSMTDNVEDSLEKDTVDEEESPQKKMKPKESVDTSVKEVNEKLLANEKKSETNAKDVEDALKAFRKDVDKSKISNKCEEGTESQKKRSIEEEDVHETKKRKVMEDTTNSPPNQQLTVKKKKKRKRNKRDKGECLDGMSLKVMSKREWTRLRNQYLNMQKRNMESLKWDMQHKKYVPAPVECPRVPSKHQPQFVPNAVIKISFEEPPQDPKKLQEAIREGSGGCGGQVAYVETSAIEKDVYVRFVTGEAAAAYMQAGLWSRMILLSGEDEQEYWNHCINSWQMRRMKKNKHMKGTCNDVPNKFRGREKLLLKAMREAKSDKPCSHKVFD